MNSSMFNLSFGDYQSNSSMPYESEKKADNFELNKPSDKEKDEKEKKKKELKRLFESGEYSSLALNAYSLNELYDYSYDANNMLIENFLSEGTYILAGAPKVGKSFLVAQIAYHVSKGLDLWGYKTHKATVLYLALEDNLKRLQSRMSTMFGFEENNNLFFSTKSDKLNSGLEEQLDRFILKHPNTKLIIIDTLQKIREDVSDTYSYSKDYEIIGKLKKYADSKNICLLIVHHTRKQKAGDKFDMISGTSGILGCADGALILSKERRIDDHATLNTVSRDRQDQKLRLIRNSKTLVWDFEGCEAEVWQETVDETVIMTAKFISKDNPEWSGTATELAQLLNTDLSPNLLTRKLNCNSSALLEKYNIKYSNQRTSEKRTISLKYVCKNDDDDDDDANDD